jgi:hypothetical protein
VRQAGGVENDPPLAQAEVLKKLLELAAVEVGDRGGSENKGLLGAGDEAAVAEVINDEVQLPADAPPDVVGLCGEAGYLCWRKAHCGKVRCNVRCVTTNAAETLLS